jgi:hypothetical protein
VYAREELMRMLRFGCVALLVLLLGVGVAHTNYPGKARMGDPGSGNQSCVNAQLFYPNPGMMMYVIKSWDEQPYGYKHPDVASPSLVQNLRAFDEAHVSPWFDANLGKFINNHCGITPLDYYGE